MDRLRGLADRRITEFSNSDTQKSSVSGGGNVPRLCENYFQKFNVVIHDSFIAVIA
jgi:hypothetical protein